jgi:hypothetical protein
MAIEASGGVWVIASGIGQMGELEFDWLDRWCPLGNTDMKNCIRLVLSAALVVSVAGAKGQKGSKPGRVKPDGEATVSESTLPDKVRGTFVEKFPNAVILKAKSAKQDGVVVWHVQFRDGKSQRAADIADDGTMLVVIANLTVKTVPKQAMRKLEAAAKNSDARLGRLERLDVTSEAKDGKVAKLDKQETRYAAELIKDGQTAKVIVDEKGRMLDEPKFEASKEKMKKSAA